MTASIEPVETAVTSDLIEEAKSHQKKLVVYGTPEFLRDWHEGVDLIDKLIAALSQLQSDKQQMQTMMWMAGEDFVFFSEGGAAYILCSDTFGYACADAEPIALEEALLVADLYKQFSHDGWIAWVSKKRNQLPLDKYRNEKFHAALNLLAHPNQSIGEQSESGLDGWQEMERSVPGFYGVPHCDIDPGYRRCPGCKQLRLLHEDGYCGSMSCIASADADLSLHAEPKE